MVVRLFPLKRAASDTLTVAIMIHIEALVYLRVISRSTLHHWHSQIRPGVYHGGYGDQGACFGDRREKEVVRTWTEVSQLWGKYGPNSLFYRF